MAGRRLRLALLGVVAVAAALAGLWQFLLAPSFARTVQETLGRGDYRLAATDGSEFTEARLRDGPSAVFFGFTHCPEICPTTLGEIAAWSADLGPEAGRIRFWFVTVDPERDTVGMLRDYLSWNPNVTGAAGSPEEVAKAVAAFRVYARRIPLEDGDYTMDHSALVLLFDKAGRFQDIITYQEDPASAEAKLRRLLS